MHASFINPGDSNPSASVVQRITYDRGMGDEPWAEHPKPELIDNNAQMVRIGKLGDTTHLENA
jgi:hypothetical protein